MSGTIFTKKSNFVIFGAGHDYTLADSGRGERIFFSHPYVPLNSRVYAGQFYFLAPIYDDEDETVEPVMTDVVKDDIAHCTFTPNINDIFDTEGEVQVKVRYRREYIYPESTILVEKELTQTIEVVNHGTVANTYPNLDVYSDGYGFIRPNNVNTVEVKRYNLAANDMTKCSSIPWRATGLGNNLAGSVNYGTFTASTRLTDISELKYADTSNCTILYKLFSGSGLTDISALEDWDVSKVTYMCNLFYGTSVRSLEPLHNWNTESLIVLELPFETLTLLNLKGLEDWNVSNVTSLQGTFSGLGLQDITALKDWDVAKVTNMQSTFAYNPNLVSLEGLEDWDVSKVSDMLSTFENCRSIKNVLSLSNWHPKPWRIYSIFNSCHSLVSTKGLDNFDVSNCTIMREAFYDCPKLLKLEGLENWDTSKVQTFYGMFMWDRWIESYLPLKDWSFESCTDIVGMFSQNANVTTLDGIIWNLSHISYIGGMFTGYNMCWAEDLGKKLVEYDYSYEDYEHNVYYKTGYGPYPVIGKDASQAEDWTVNGTGLGAFDSTWSNRPSWN